MAARHAEIERVALFGSLARGDAARGSDVDLPVVLSHSALPFLERISRYMPAGGGIGVDVFPYTREELAGRSLFHRKTAR
jgi:predicted nucleotidyltransferase